MTSEYFTKRITGLALKAIYIASLLTLGAENMSAQSFDKIHVGVIYPISTNGKQAPLDTNNLSIHLLAGVSAAEEGLSFAGLTNVVKGSDTGVAFAGFSNHVGGAANGLLFAGFINTYGKATGMQFAGFSNISAGYVKGAQFSGFLNRAANVSGAQFAGFANVAQNLSGPQFSGFINTADSVKGPQFAGFANIAGDDVGGSQFAGFINTAKNVKGSQFAGFINVAKKVKGAQVAGFVNVADSSDYPIGLLNLVKNGEMGLAVTIDETQTTLLSFRSGGKVLYGILGAGYNLSNDDEVYAFEAGFGAHFFNTKNFRLNLELATLCLEDFKTGEYFKSSFRLLPGLKLGKHLELFGGPVLNYLNTNTEEGKTLSNHYISQWQNRWSSDFQAFYIGYSGGLHLIF